jgi:hypothetical protein
MPRQRKVERMPGRTPPRNKATPPTPPAEMFKRRQLMRELLLRNAPMDQIVGSFADAADKGFFAHVNEQQLKRLVQECKQALESESLESVHIERLKAKQRLHGHIAKAAAAGHHGAVMQGERLLAEITGTLMPVVVHVNDTTQAFTDALTNTLSAMGPQQLQALLDGEDVPLGGTYETTAEPAEASDGAAATEQANGA